ncbi:MAG: orotidine-5'-phosphate decarboxylase [Bdellovibrionaceae bacterium]|nr:orotidine-5'-phosphate decarboxylase [Bdellovibrionales bacterium]MCB9255011.1 orotidine-5'-phosphate decarboxylase [Pseudobdellovibrionaceae bacterium]
MSKPFDKVIVALDHDHPDKAKALVDEVGSLIDWYKIGPVLFTRSGQELIRFLHERNKKIFLDLKLHDIPNVVAKTVEEVAEMGVQYLTIHSLGGRKMMEEASSACRGLPLKLLAVTMLTSHSTEEFNELGFQGDSESMVLHLQQMAMESRCAGIVCSAHEIKRIRQSAVPGFLLVTPGIRLKDREVYQDDQSRVATPAEAIEWGADQIVVGRPITGAREPRQVVEHLFG